MNLLIDSILTLTDGKTVSLPTLFAKMVRSEVIGFRALRPHQRPAWHMFLVQLGALAVWNARVSELPDDSNVWCDLLRSLTSEFSDDEPWCLFVESRDKPAFMQSPDPGNLKWKDVKTADALDLLITSKNHDVKSSVASRATAEDWLFSLVSLQTCEGYGGRGNHGIARMNGGSSSRPMVSLAPTSSRDLTISASDWWRRDTSLLLKSRQQSTGNSLGQPGGPALLWCMEWPEGIQLDLRDLDPWFIEVCRRVRLRCNKEFIEAERANSSKSRIAAESFKGNVGDPWAPVHKQQGKSLTLSSGNFDYKRLNELLFKGDWHRPQLANPSDEEQEDMLLVAEALSRGNSKTEGFKSRVTLVPGRVLPLFSSKVTSTCAEAQIEEIAAFDKALRNGLALMAANGIRDDLQKKHYEQTSQARRRFNLAADRLFFPSLWRRVEVDESSVEDQAMAKREFLGDLKQAAESTFDEFLPAVSGVSVFRPRAEARARRAFHSTLRRDSVVNELFAKEDTDG